MSVRLRRLYAEYERLKVLFADHERIRIVEVLGDPPDRYVVEYRVKGLVDNNGTIEESTVHRVRISLGPNYPFEMASFVAITPIFHPNIDHLAVCTADQDAASTKIEDNIVFVGRMITFQDYNLQSPRNGDAARWTAANLTRLPLEKVNLWPSKALDEENLPRLRPDQIPSVPEPREEPQQRVRCANCQAPDSDGGLRECSSHHHVCADCTLQCSNCKGSLCLLCPVQACSECREHICAECTATCSDCNRIVCPSHASQCAICRAMRCGSCSAECPGCHRKVCRQHLADRGLCPACSARTPEKPAVDLPSPVANDQARFANNLPSAVGGVPHRRVEAVPNPLLAPKAPIRDIAATPPASEIPVAVAGPRPLPAIPQVMGPQSPPVARLSATPAPAIRVRMPSERPAFPGGASQVEISLPVAPVPGFSTPAIPKLVITAEEALRIPDSALQTPNSQVHLAPRANTGLSGKAITSFIFGLIGIPIVGLLVGWFGIWFGIMAIREIDRSSLRGRGLAVAGITLGIASIVLWVIVVAVYGPSLFTSRFADVPSIQQNRL